MALSSAAFEQQLTDAGNRLLQSLSSDHELLPLLDQLEILLSSVDQSPSLSMQSALSPSVKAMVARELLGHSNEHVKVAVACCVSEITRITAPNAPYDDDTMKEVFQLIVSSFAMLNNEPKILNNKRASILETFAKVRLSVLMLDLECDSLIIEMFQNFFSLIRESHTEMIFASMAAIMALVLEESEDISVGLLTPVLDSLKLDNQESAPVASSLGQIVFKKCAPRIKRYLPKVLKSLGTSFDNYHEVVSSLSLDDNIAVIQTDANYIGDQKLAEDSKESSDIETADVTEHKGVTTSTSDGSSLRKLKSPRKNNFSKDLNNQNKNQIDDGVDSQRVVDPQPSNKRRRKSRGAETLKSPLKSPRIGEIAEITAKKSKNAYNSCLEDPSTMDRTPLPEEADKNTIISTLTERETKDVHITSPPPSEPAEDRHPVKGGRQTKKEGSARGLNTPVSLPKKVTSEGTPLPESSSQNIPVMGIDSQDAGDARTPVSADNPTIDTNLRESKIKGTASPEADHRSEGGASQKSRVKRGSKKAVVTSSELKPIKKDLNGLPICGVKTTVIDLPSETPKLNSKGKSTPEKDATPNVKQRGAELLHSRIQVWWPDDERYYKGVIESYNRSSKKHKVVYDDGDTEILNLDKEKWQFINHDKKDFETNHPVKSPEMEKEEAKNNEEGAPLELSYTTRSRKSKGGEESQRDDVVSPVCGGSEALGGGTPVIKEGGGSVEVEKVKTSTRRKQKPARVC